MPIVNRTILKSCFETGDVPTEDPFGSLIDSFLGVELGFGADLDDHSLRLDTPAGGFLQDAFAPVLLSEGELVSGALAQGTSFGPNAAVGAGSGLPGNGGFLGVSFELLGAGGQTETHYGFLELNVNGPGGATPYAIELVGFAYETDADVGISTFALPEPATALLLAIGLALGAWFGSRRRSRAGA